MATHQINTRTDNPPVLGPGGILGHRNVPCRKCGKNIPFCTYTLDERGRGLCRDCRPSIGEWPSR
jgi:hypothetical protein